MKTIKIYIFDSAKFDENDNLGFRKNNKCCNLVDFHFDETKLSGYWIDPETDDDTLTQDIVFYVGGQSFKTPLTEQSEALLISCLNLMQNEQYRKTIYCR